MKSFNRFWILGVLAVAAFSLSAYFNNPYMNVIIFGVLFVLWCGIGAWITDTLKENEYKVLNKFCKVVLRVNLDKCEEFEDE